MLSVVNGFIIFVISSVSLSAWAANNCVSLMQKYLHETYTATGEKLFYQTDAASDPQLIGETHNGKAISNLVMAENFAYATADSHLYFYYSSSKQTGLRLLGQTHDGAAITDLLIHASGFSLTPYIAAGRTLYTYSFARNIFYVQTEVPEGEIIESIQAGENEVFYLKTNKHAYRFINFGKKLERIFDPK
jgi:hypothetical protein